MRAAVLTWVGRRRWRLVGVIFLAQVISVVVFGVVYRIVGTLRADGSDGALGDALWFSVLTHATLGYGEVLASGASRQLVAVQVGWASISGALLAAATLFAFLSPRAHWIKFDPRIAFVPQAGQFRFRFANTGWAPIASAELAMVASREFRTGHDTTGRSRHIVDLEASRLPVVDPGHAFIRSTVQCEPEPGGSTDELHVRLHPGNFDDFSKFDFWITGSSPFGQASVAHEYGSADVYCGRFIDAVTPSSDKVDFVKFGQTRPEHDRYCLDECRFRPVCRIQNKAVRASTGSADRSA